MKKETAIVFMAAGMSSRFGGRAKQFINIGPNNETLIEFSLNQALKSEFSKIVFIVGDKTEKLFKEKFGAAYKNLPILYAYQKYNPAEREKPWGTVDALCSIKGIIDCPFVICNGDDIYGEESFKTLFEHLQKSDEEAIMGYVLKEVIPEAGTTNRGIIQEQNNYAKKIEENFSIESSKLKEKNLTPESLCSMNIFALHPQTLNFLDEILQKFKESNKENRKAECLLPNEISKLIETNKIKMKIYQTNEKWLGVTNPEDEAVVREKLREPNKNKI